MLAIEFGSVSRGDNDCSSDRDILLIASDWDQLAAEKKSRLTQGYSVSSFTNDTSSYLVQAGSLFFKHVIDEGILVQGSEDEFHKLAMKWSPARSYQEEIDCNIDLLEVLDFVPETNCGRVATVDIIVCSLRNILIRKLAKSGIYVFSWKEVFNKATELGLICEDDTKVFLMARAIKNLYRQGQIKPVSLSFIDDLVNGSKSVLGANHRYRFSARKDINKFVEQCNDGSYKQLRALELLCAEYNFHPSMQGYLDWVKEPGYFIAKGPNHKIKTLATN